MKHGFLALGFLIVVVVGALHIFRDKHMANDWEVLIKDVKVSAKPAGIWTRAIDWLNGPAILKIESGNEEWQYSESDGSKTKADGHLTALLACKGCVLPSAPVGALIGKIGGSSASIADGTLFPVGQFTLLEIDKSKGPLYLTINDEITGFANNQGEITVTISARPAPVPVPVSPAAPASK